MSPDKLGMNRPRAGTPTDFTRRSFKAICWFIADSGPGLSRAGDFTVLDLMIGLRPPNLWFVLL